MLRRNVDNVNVNVNNNDSDYDNDGGIDSSSRLNDMERVPPQNSPHTVSRSNREFSSSNHRLRRSARDNDAHGFKRQSYMPDLLVDTLVTDKHTALVIKESMGLFRSTREQKEDEKKQAAEHDEYTRRKNAGDNVDNFNLNEVSSDVSDESSTAYFRRQEDEKAKAEANFMLRAVFWCLCYDYIVQALRWLWRKCLDKMSDCYGHGEEAVAITGQTTS